MIAGASVAGLSVAETLRREGFTGRITMIGEEKHLPYDRPPLSKEILSGKWPRERAWLRQPAAIDALGLDLRLGVRATGLDDQARRVRLSDETAADYDELVIATGARARRLPGTGGIAGVHVLRTLDDAFALREQLQMAQRLVVVGAGFLGAEAASVATLGGTEVTLVSDIPAPLADVLGPELGSMLLDVHLAHGVKVLAGTGVRELLVDGGRTHGVRLADGRAVHADAVLVAIGSVPTVDWLAGSGVETGNGVVCDRYCQAAPGVWAAGDVASWEHVGFGERLRIEHRTNAAEQGMAVARNILAGDERKPFTPIPYIWSDQYDLKIQIHGLPRGAEGFAVTEGSSDERSLLALYNRNGAVRAAVGVNRIRATRQARALIAKNTPWTEVVRSG
ncbi:3-phenylpropionate/trans-cinnamate dioxygenase ferredoxin reductase subunit [Amycolatopsis bartoniae]|uniref:Pyridine nucleotide-disulfide oxidoreductase n=1 Tax=Amycolatopsis bartoniae TaxID=941986 RepID=A0A8H9IN07_9PSEU|nr:FAD-dependent oxidoreductase [Amycolatopsis bartoniae]MBB2939898.1 3-phenylpropionate/trans-cinnamate dioxygenase ferredoxin reductase subunit [Amycolatopsis bartoniae]GHF35793.1 pyridine nucleotide-disulfide oxidoreductase [Amycolatopsis bartoniae]